MLADWPPWLQVYRGLLRGVQVVAVKVFNDGPQYTSDSSHERLQTLQVLKQQRETLIRQEIAVLKSCRDHNIVQFVGACIQVGLLTYCVVGCQASYTRKTVLIFRVDCITYICFQKITGTLLLCYRNTHAASAQASHDLALTGATALLLLSCSPCRLTRQFSDFSNLLRFWRNQAFQYNGLAASGTNGIYYTDKFWL